LFLKSLEKRGLYAVRMFVAYVHMLNLDRTKGECPSSKNNEFLVYTMIG
jgi:hypothetical protein